MSSVGLTSMPSIPGKPGGPGGPLGPTGALYNTNTHTLLIHYLVVNLKI